MPQPTAKIDAYDLSIVIPFRLDCPEREENLKTVLRFATEILEGVEIILLESGPKLTAEALGEHPNVTYRGEKTDHGFHRTRLLNEGIEALASRRFAASYDADALIYPQAMQTTLDRLRAGCGYAFPFSGRFLNVSGSMREQLIADASLKSFPPAHLESEGRRRREIESLGEESVGGVIIFDRDVFRQTGGYHEHFLYWGFEDTELADRLEKFGHQKQHAEGFPLVHLDHPRSRRSKDWYAGNRKNKGLCRRLGKLKRQEIESMIAEGGLRGLPPPEMSLGQKIREALGVMGRKK